MLGAPRTRSSSSSTGSSPVSCSACSRWASCSSTARPASSTSPSATWAWSVPACSCWRRSSTTCRSGWRSSAALIVGTLYGAVAPTHRHPPAVQRAARHRARGDDRHRPAVAGARSPRTPTSTVPAARFPLRSDPTSRSASVRLTGAQLSILIVVPLIAIFLAWFLTRTTFGKSVKASAENADLARLNGISPKLVSMFVWAVAGALSTLSLSLMAGQTGAATDLATLGPSTLVRALAAAVIGGMVSFPRAFVAGVAIGVIEAVVRFNYLDQPGLMDFLLLPRDARRGLLPEPPERGRDPSVLVRAQAAADPRTPARDLVGAPSRPRRARVAGGRRHRVAARRHPAVAPPAVHDDPRVRVVRPVAHDPHRLGGAAVAGADGLRRRRRATWRPRSTAASPSTSAGATPA